CLHAGSSFSSVDPPYAPVSETGTTSVMPPMLKAIARVDMLFLDDWGLAVLAPLERRDLLEILEDRHGRGSTIVTSQLPVEHWHEAIGDPTLADAILDHLVHNTHRLQLAGESMRRRAAKSLDLSPQT
ncbi:ATP-binding protein, partial [Paracoccus denitrificans]|uniref:ATP-binding protein n=1 Tax=Paracoccus denitrificans TaxID=266 RepID=UPI001F3C4DEB